jgi:hypothetical protein
VTIFSRDGAAIAVAPEDERELAEEGWADEVRKFEGEGVGDALSDVNVRLGVRPGNVFGYAGIRTVLGSAFPAVVLVDASICLPRLRSVLTTRELSMFDGRARFPAMLM